MVAESFERSTGERPPLGWRFWLSWVLVTTAGWALCWGLGCGLARFLLGPWNLHWTFAAGAMPGGMQWLVLRREVPHRGAGRWVLASILAWLAALVLASVVYVYAVVWADFGLPWAPVPIRAKAFSDLGAAGGALVGVVIGAIQWTVLRKHVSRAGAWIAASIVAWSVAWGITLSIGSPLVATFLPGAPGPWRGTGSGAQAGALGGAVYGAITGAALVWLLRQRLPHTRAKEGAPRAE